jgi:hypothetical protein
MDTNGAIFTGIRVLDIALPDGDVNGKQFMDT